MQSICNEKMEFTFDEETGKLVSIRNLVTGNEYLNGDKESGNPFALYYDFTRDFEISVEDCRALDAPDGPASITRRVLRPSDELDVTFSSSDNKDKPSLDIAYKDPAGQWRAELTICLKPGEVISRWGLKVTNLGSSPAQLMGIFPFISGLKLGDGGDNLMVVNRQAGYIQPLWSYEGGIYGNSVPTALSSLCTRSATCE